MSNPTTTNSEPIAAGLLLSGGIDSSILLAHLAAEGHRVQPVHIATDCDWAAAELDATRQFVAALDHSFIEPLVVLRLPLADLYGSHWSLTGDGVPGLDAPDEEVYLWGRNPLLLVKAAVWCQMHGIERLALGTLAGNPFADATPEFFEQFAAMMHLATGKPLKLWCPFSHRNKHEVLSLGEGLPLQLTFSCLSPQAGQHCGQCNKCFERANSLARLPGGDPTRYATPLEISPQDATPVAIVE